MSRAQDRFLAHLDGTCVMCRRMRDGTVMPFASETRTINALIAKGVIHWVEAGKDGYTYNGVVRVGHVAYQDRKIISGPVRS